MGSFRELCQFHEDETAHLEVGDWSGNGVCSDMHSQWQAEEILTYTGLNNLQLHLHDSGRYWTHIDIGSTSRVVRTLKDQDIQ